MLKIIKALYDKLDVTDILNNKIVNNTLKIKANNDIFGDPNFGIYKKLTIDYEYNNEIKTKTIFENEDLILPKIEINDTNQRNILLLTSCNRIKQVLLALTINSYIIKKPFSVIIADCSTFGLSFDEAKKLDYNGTNISIKNYCSDITLFDKYIKSIPNIKEYKLIHHSPKMHKHMGDLNLIALGLSQAALFGESNIRNDFCLKLTGVCLLRYDLLSQLPFLLKDHDIFTFNRVNNNQIVSTRVFGCRSKPISQFLINLGWDKLLSGYLNYAEETMTFWLKKYNIDRINHQDHDEFSILMDEGKSELVTRENVTKFIQENNIPTDLPIIQEFLNGDIYD